MEDWLKEAYKQIEKMPESALQIREIAENDLYFFAKLVNPGYLYGSVHKEIYQWIQEYTLYGKGTNNSANKLIMLPRGHLKSHMIATTAAWLIVRHPEITMLYLSATADLAMTQLYAIKNILESAQFKKYWPEFLNPEVGKRDKWSATKISVDHPKRTEENIRDATISIAGLTTNTTGWHADVILCDDIVVPENAYTEDGRESVAKKSSQFTSIRNTGGFTLAAGTRYHPNDIYATWKQQVVSIYTDEGEEIRQDPVWDIKEYKVEEEGFFLWPRTVRPDGKAFGFDIHTLARISAEYIDRTQYYAQYYNDPNDPSSDRISRDRFQYYNPRLLKRENGRWSYNGKRLNIYAAVDFAFSLMARADWTAIVVVGIDSDKNLYVLDIDRFKAIKSIEHFKRVKQLHSKWGFNKLQAEVTAAQITVVEDIKDYVKKDGLRLSVVEYRPSKAEGSKEERIAAVLEHRYENQEVWHFEGGLIPMLEEELVLSRPAHDDLKDALASAVSIAIAPARSSLDKIGDFMTPFTKVSRFGGIA